MRFRHRIRTASAGPLQLLDFRGGGSFALERIQAPDRAVLWLPLQGVVEEQVEGCSLQPHPGMGLWIRPNTGLLATNDEEYRVEAEASPMLLNPFSRQRSGAVVTLLRLASQLVQSVAAGAPGSTMPPHRHPARTAAGLGSGRALHLSQRTLQASFRAEREMSPVEAVATPPHHGLSDHARLDVVPHRESARIAEASAAVAAWLIELRIMLRLA